jgi:hybrid cluster-associated redox disulfide protein
MTETTINPKTSVADLLARNPQVIPVFIKHHMSCVGCSMSAFETLEDAARIYAVPLDVFMSELTSLLDRSEK